MADGRKTTSNKTQYDVQIVDDDVMTCLGQHTNRIITSDGGVEAAERKIQFRGSPSKGTKTILPLRSRWLRSGKRYTT
jgi:hypothetical protein